MQIRCRYMCVRPLLAISLILPASGVPAQLENASGLQLMEAVYERHRQYPYVYEEQSMILVDRDGYRETRKLRRYSRVEEDGTVKFLLLFDSPREVKGVALLAVRRPSGEISKSVYLPAYGERLIESTGGGSDEDFLGTDFSVENLAGEVLANYRYARRRDMKINDLDYYLVDVFEPGDDTAADDPIKRHYILKDNLYITRTDYFDELGRVKKRRTLHDLKHLDEDMWRANMILMENRAERHRSLIKIDRRVFSPDYVPAEIFTREWLFSNQPPLKAADEEEGDGDPPTDMTAPDSAVTGGSS